MSEFKQLIDIDLKKISESRTAIVQISSNISELEKRRKTAYEYIIKKCDTIENFKTLFTNDSGRIQSCIGTLQLELRYIEMLKKNAYSFNIQGSGIKSRERDYQLLSDIDQKFNKMKTIILNFLEYKTKIIKLQIDLLTFPSKYQSSDWFIAEYQKYKAKEMIEDFINSLKDEDREKMKFMEKISKKQNELEKMFIMIANLPATKVKSSDTVISKSAIKQVNEEISGAIGSISGAIAASTGTFH